MMALSDGPSMVDLYVAIIVYLHKTTVDPSLLRNNHCGLVCHQVPSMYFVKSLTFLLLAELPSSLK